MAQDSVNNKEKKMTKKTIEFKILSPLAKVPQYSTIGAAGMDITAAIEIPVWIAPGENKLIPTGIAININDSSIVAILNSRSGMGLNDKIRLGNSLGVIDSDYLKEIGVILYNDGDKPYCVMPSDRIAQLLFMPVLMANIMVVEEFSVSNDRGGFGSSGK